MCLKAVLMGGFFCAFVLGLDGIWMILVWLIPVLLLVLIFNHFRDGPVKRRDRKAQAIPDERYAGGEIDSAQYLKMRRDLSG
jgi:uncharacterized membrane protein